MTADGGCDGVPFSASREAFEEIVGWLDGAEAAGLDHGDLEDELSVRGREVLRRLLQDHLSLRSAKEERVDVVDIDGTTHGSVERDHSRLLASVFGEVEFVRLAYRHRGHPNLHPGDAALNLPVERHSHGLRRLAAIESARGSFGEAVEAICRATGVGVGKRQVEELAHRAAGDVEAFYEAAKAPATERGDVVVLSVDAKGIVMRPDALRPATARAAARASTKLTTRLSRGEKSNRKRMAEVGAVYDVTPVARTSADVMVSKHGDEPPPPGPEAKNKWITASVADEAIEVIGRVFDEAHRRDRRHARPWVALVDGNRHQIDAIRAEAAKRNVKVPVLVDYVHVLEYLWAAAWCFFAEGTPAAEEWVRDRAMAVLEGNAKAVAAGIRRRLTAENVAKSKRKKADDAARYLTNNAAYLDYPTALAQGLPIATGIIEGTCRFLVKDRMAITGARWNVEGAEAVLKLRAVKSNGDFDNYWKFHTAEEHRRNHEDRYDDRVIPLAA